MVARLHRAIESEQFLLRYQPVVELNTGRIRGAEALIRWQPPGGDLIPPVEFIPLAERSGLIGPITSWVVDQVCRQHVAWRQRGIDIELAFNLPVTLWEPAAIRNMLQLIRSHGIAPPDLLIEVTESTAMRQTADNEAVLRMIGSAGLRLALDDFGTGHSSLARLKQMPATTLKIDRSFVRDLPERRRVRGARGRRSSSSRETSAWSRSPRGSRPRNSGVPAWMSGCTLGQGYLLSQPVSAAEVEALWSAPARPGRVAGSTGLHRGSLEAAEIVGSRHPALARRLELEDLVVSRRRRPRQRWVNRPGLTSARRRGTTAPDQHRPAVELGAGADIRRECPHRAVDLDAGRVQSSRRSSAVSLEA